MQLLTIKKINDALGPTYKSLVRCDQQKLMAEIEKIIPFVPKRQTLVHYDLQHANILINHDTIRFIDLEDIYFAPKSIAVSHALFKLIRHSIYRNKRDYREILSGSKYDLILMAKELLNLEEREVYYSALMRTVNDLTNIVNAQLDKHDDRYLYDLRKKVSNLYEIMYIFKKFLPTQFNLPKITCVK